MAEINEAEVMDALRECYDPEIPVNIVDLGLVYNIGVDDETGNVTVLMTLTAMGCPMGARSSTKSRCASKKLKTSRVAKSI